MDIENLENTKQDNENKEQNPPCATKGKFRFEEQWKSSKIKVDEFGNLANRKKTVNLIRQTCCPESKSFWYQGYSFLPHNFGGYVFYYFLDAENNVIYGLSNCWNDKKQKNIYHNGNQWKLTGYKKPKDPRDGYWILASCKTNDLTNFYNSKNFYNTEGTFKYHGEISQSKFTRQFETQEWTLHNMKKIVADVLKCQVKKIEFINSSWDQKTKKGSFYFRTTDEKHLIRVSDHWTDCNNNNVITCQNINNSRWSLKVGLFNKPKHFETFKVGVIKFDNLKKIVNDEETTITHIEFTKEKTEPEITKIKYWDSIKENFANYDKHNNNVFDILGNVGDIEDFDIKFIISVDDIGSKTANNVFLLHKNFSDFAYPKILLDVDYKIATEEIDISFRFAKNIFVPEDKLELENGMLIINWIIDNNTGKQEFKDHFYWNGQIFKIDKNGQLVTKKIDFLNSIKHCKFMQETSSFKPYDGEINKTLLNEIIMNTKK